MIGSIVLDVVVVPVGGDGLIDGIGAYLTAVAPHVRGVGVESIEADAMARSPAMGRPADLGSEHLVLRRMRH